MQNVNNGITYLVPVSVWFEGALNFHANVVSLLLRQHRELGAKGPQVQFSDLLIKCLWEQIHLVFIALVVLPIVQQIQLAEHLIREGARHDERWVPSCTAKVQQPARSKDDDAVAIRENEAVHLRLDVFHLNARATFKFLHLNLIVEVADVANDGVIFHFLHVLQGDNLEVACGGYENVHLVENALHFNNLEAFHARLQRTDGIALRDQHAAASATHREGGALANIAIASNQNAFATDHHIRGAHDAVWQGMSATVNVVKLLTS